MKSNVPWSIKGIDPEAREAAKKAARQAGMTLGEWLNEQILVASEEEAAGGMPFAASPVTIEHLRELVASLNRLNERLQTNEKRSETAISGLNQGLSSALERIEAMESRPGAAGGEEQDALIERIERIENGAVDKRSVDGLKALEKALERTLAQFESVSEETLGRLSANEQAIDGLTTRVERMDTQFSEALKALRDSVEDINTQIAETEQTAQSVMAEARAAASSSDEEFIQRTSNKLRILGNEIKRTSDRIQSLDEKMMRLSGKIEASEQRSAEGIGQISQTIAALSQELVDFDRDQSASVREAREVMEEASSHADDRLTTLRSSFESMLERIETIAEKGASAEAGEETRGAAVTPQHRRESQPVNRQEAQPASRQQTQPQRRSDAPQEARRSILDTMGPVPDLDIEDEDDRRPRRRGAAPTARRDTASRRDPAGDAPSEEDFDAVFGEPIETRAGHRPVESGWDDDGDDNEAETPDDLRPAVSAAARTRPEERLTPKQKVILAARDRRRRLEAQAALAEGDAGEDFGHRQDARNAPDAPNARHGQAELPEPADDDDWHGDEPRDERQSGDRMRAERRHRDEDVERDGLLSGLTRRLSGRSERAAVRQDSRQEDADRDEDETELYRSDRARERDLPGDPGDMPARPSASQADRLRSKYAEHPERARRGRSRRGGGGDRRGLPVVPLAVCAVLVVAVLGYILLKDTLMGGISSIQQPAAPAPVADLPVEPDVLYERGMTLVTQGETDAQARRGVDLVRRAAREGYPPAEYRLAEFLRLGQGMTADAATARRWYTRAAEGGNVAAMHRLGSLYANGDGGERNDFSALAWFEEAAQYGYLDSIYNLGLLFDPTVELEIADEIRDDGERAYFWYALADRLGDPDARADAQAVGETLSPERRSAIDAEVAAWQAEPLVPGANQTS